MTTETTKDIETLRQALGRLRDHGIHNLVQSGYSSEDAHKIVDYHNDEIDALNRIEKRLGAINE